MKKCTNYLWHVTIIRFLICCVVAERIIHGLSATAALFVINVVRDMKVPRGSGAR